MCLQETKVQDHQFPVDAIRQAGYHASFRGMKAYNGVATLTRTPPEKIIHGLHEGADTEDFRTRGQESMIRASAGAIACRKSSRSLASNSARLPSSRGSSNR